MRIAVFTDVFLPKIDGVVNSLQQLVLELDRQGHSILLFTPNSKGAPRSLGQRIQIYHLPSLPAFVYPDLKLGVPQPAVAKRFSNFQADISLIVTPITVGSLGMYLSKRKGIPIVSIFHGYFMKPEYLQLIGIRRGAHRVEAMMWKVFRRFYDQSHTIISPSAMVKLDLEGHYFKKPIEICYNGLAIDTTLTDPVHQRLLQLEQAMDLQDKKVVIYVGRLSKEKNLFCLLRTFKHVVDVESHARLLIIGGGPGKNELEQYALKLGIGRSVIFYGEIQHTELMRQQLFRLGKVFCTSSTSEVQPMSMIEALFFSLPLVAPSVPSMKSFVDGNGFLIDANDFEAQGSRALLQILQDDQLQQQFAEKSEQLSKHHEIRHTAEQYMKIFQDMSKIHTPYPHLPYANSR